MKHQRFKLIIFCSNDNPVLILTDFTARSNFATSAFIWENVLIMDNLEIIASFGLEFGLLCQGLFRDGHRTQLVQSISTINVTQSAPYMYK